MLDFLRDHQLNMMLSLGSICLIIALFVSITKTLPKQRKRILLLLELSAAVLLFADRAAYLYRGDVSTAGFYMVRISNYLVFAATLLVILSVNLYLADLLTHESGLSAIPTMLKLVSVLLVLGELLLIVSQFTGMYYTFDAQNRYQRAPLFFICYVTPLLASLLMLVTILRYYARLNKGVREALLLFTVTPTLASVMQIFLYGLSLTNLAMVGMLTVLYIFALLDMNATVERAHKIETANIEREKESSKKLFAQTATAFVSAVDRRDPYSHGNSARVADYAKMLAERSGMEPEECEKVYYAALLHNVGLIGIPDSVIQEAGTITEAEREIMHRKPVIGSEILSSITEYPFLSTAARSSHERYNGSGYPDGLKGEEIPEIARIVAVADAYVSMTSEKRYRGAKPDFLAREEFVKGSGEAFDPKYAELMVKLIDADMEKAQQEPDRLETALSCGAYRDAVSYGIPIEGEVTNVRFRCSRNLSDAAHPFFGPSLIVFDSFDRKVHSSEKAAAAYQYTEYGEIWFDQHSISTAARAIKETELPKQEQDFYEITMGRFEDHLRLKLSGPQLAKEVTVALPGGSNASYIALTGENCEIWDITARKTGEIVGEHDIARIASEIRYIDRMESDLKNIQIDRARSAATEGIELREYLELTFHSMSLPSAHLVWHCPYVVLYSSEDGKVHGANYREYALVKLCGENEGDTAFAQNSVEMKRTKDFPGWDVWKELNKAGLECSVELRRRNNRIVFRSKTLGIEMENTTSISEPAGTVFAALTGDRVALTDIRVRQI